MVIFPLRDIFKIIFLHSWHREFFVYAMFTLYHFSSDLRRYVPDLKVARMNTTSFGANLLMSWILHNQMRFWQLDWNIITSTMTDLDVRVIRAASTLLACLQVSVGGTVTIRASSHLCGSMVLSSAGWRCPCLLWHLVSRGTKGCSKVGGSSGAMSSLLRRSSLTQGKLPGRHILWTQIGSYHQSIVNSIKWTKIWSSFVQMLQSTRDSPHRVVENQSCHEKERTRTRTWDLV